MFRPNPLRCFKCQRFEHSQTACRGQLTCSRCATVGHPSTDCTLEPKCVNCFQSHPSDSKLCSKWKTEKEIQVIKTNRNIPYVEARKLIAPQLSQFYAQVTKLSTTTTTTQTDENITKIVCPPLILLQPLISVPNPTISSSVAAVNKSSTSTQAELVPFTSSVTVASPSKSSPPNSVIDTTPTTSNSLSISAASSSSTALSMPSHPLQNVYMSTSMKRLYDARPSNIRPFIDRMKLHISELDLPNVHIQQRNLFLFQPWNKPRFRYINSFATYSKSTVAPVVFQRVFAYHRSQYSRYSAIYTDGSKRADYVGCGVVIEDVMHGYRLDTSCSIFTAQAVAIYRALQLIDSNMSRKYCIYTDSMSVLEAIENYNDRCHPVVCNILDITSRLYSKGFDIVFCWLPSHVGIIGNEQADSAAKTPTPHCDRNTSAKIGKEGIWYNFSWVPGHVGIIGNEQTDTAARSMSDHMQRPVCYQDLKTSAQNYIHRVWQETWKQQVLNKLHSIHPSTSHWAALPMRRHDVHLT
ncbi:RNase H domain-containing protein [Trichonephila clavipes]|nr:RNase H domain-containing protein [Trichonephila clavipes]